MIELLAILFLLTMTFLLGYRSAQTVKDEQKFIRKYFGGKWLFAAYCALSGAVLGTLQNSTWFSTAALVILALNFVFGAAARKEFALYAIVQPALALLLLLL